MVQKAGESEGRFRFFIMILSGLNEPINDLQGYEPQEM